MTKPAASARGHGAGLSPDYNDPVFRSRAIAPDVAEERGYRRYGDGLGLDPIFEADPRYADGQIEWPARGGRRARSDTLRSWVERKTKRGKLGGWIMPKRAVPGSAFDDPLAQLRPDAPLLSEVWKHDHADLSPRELAMHLASERRREEHALVGLDGVHQHRDFAKYLLPPGPHGKRWDTHPRCTPDRFRVAERVFLHLEGVLKLDALVSAGEVGADVPSVTLWRRRADQTSSLDFSVERPTRGAYQDFWDGLGEHLAELEAFERLQTSELSTFLAAHVRSPVVVVCDRDWRDNPLVTLEAFELRDAVRTCGLPAVVAAPAGRSKGSDDFQAHGGRPGNLRVVEPLPARASGRPDFDRDYRGSRRGTRRRPADTLDRELSLLDWYATRSTVEGFVRMSVTRIADRLELPPTTVRRATLNLAESGALRIVGHYAHPDAIGREFSGNGRHAPPALIRLRADLLPRRWEPSVDDWLRSLR
jgi:hypothetical protein